MVKQDLKKYIKEYRHLLDKRRGTNYIETVKKSTQTVQKKMKQETTSFSEDSMLTGIRTLRTQFNDVLGQLERQFQDHYHYFLDLRKSISTEKQTLDEIYQIRYSIDTLSKLKTQVQQQESKKQEWLQEETTIQQKIIEKEKDLQNFEKDMDEKKKSLLIDYEQQAMRLEQLHNDCRVKFNKELEDKRHQHDQKIIQLEQRCLHLEQVLNERRLKFEKEMEEKRHQLDQKMLLLEKKHHETCHESKTEHDENHMRLEKEFEQKRLSFEKEVLEREANFSEKEMELAQLRTKSLTFPKELSDSIKQKEKEITDRLVLKYSHIIELTKKGHESELKLYQHKLSMLEKNLINKDTQLKDFKHKLRTYQASNITIEKKRFPSTNSSSSLSKSTPKKQPLSQSSGSSISSTPVSSSLSSTPSASSSRPVSSLSNTHGSNSSSPKILRVPRKL